MVRRDSERNHPFSQSLFNKYSIYDLQGILKEGNEYKCGIEAYQVQNFDAINFGLLNQEDEYARYIFCEQMEISYYIIIASEENNRYRIYSTFERDRRIYFNLIADYSDKEMVRWWRENQSFEQRKAMYNAAARIQNSMIDNLLFQNRLAWGVNIDGFSLNEPFGNVTGIFEKRITNNSTVTNYDPNRYFHGTYSRAGDYPSWRILFHISNQLECPLILLTFDNGEIRRLGAAKITEVDRRRGLTYHNNITPNNNVINNNKDFQRWLNNNL